MNSAQAAHLSLVVLPFADLSDDPSQDYLADGITDNLATELSRIRSSFVIARNTAFTYKRRNVDAKEMGKELGVRYLLEGSVQRDQNRLRVNAQLVDAGSGAHLWADRFEENVADLFKLQDEVVTRLARSLGVALAIAEAEKGAHSKNPDAVDLTMRALRADAGRTRPDEGSRSGDDRLQEGHMACEGRPALRARLDRGARAPRDEGLGHFDIAGPRQMIEMRAEIAVGRAGQALEPRKVEALVARVAGGQRRHHAEPNGLMDDVVRPVHRSGPPHPEAAENESAAVDYRQPQRKGGARPNITSEDHRRETKADCGEGRPEP